MNALSTFDFSIESEISGAFLWAQAFIARSFSHFLLYSTMPHTCIASIDKRTVGVMATTMNTWNDDDSIRLCTHTHIGNRCLVSQAKWWILFLFFVAFSFVTSNFCSSPPSTKVSRELTMASVGASTTLLFDLLMHISYTINNQNVRNWLLLFCAIKTSCRRKSMCLCVWQVLRQWNEQYFGTFF